MESAALPQMRQSEVATPLMRTAWRAVTTKAVHAFDTPVLPLGCVTSVREPTAATG